MTVHNHQFGDYTDSTDFYTRVCTAGCGKTWQEVQDERAAYAASRRRPELSEGERYAQEVDRRIKNDSRRERRQFVTGRTVGVRVR